MVKSIIDYAADWNFDTKNNKIVGKSVFDVGFNMVAGDKRVTFSMDDNGSGAVIVDAKGNTNLVIPRGEDRQFNFRLSDKWDWEFDQEIADNTGAKSPLRFKDVQHSKHYKVEFVTPRHIILYAQSTNSSKAQHHPFNLYVIMSQVKGSPVPLRIDPGADNPG